MLKIFNTIGQEIRTLANGIFQAGYQAVRWDGRNQSGNAVAGGVYFYQITATDANGEVKFTQTCKMAFVKVKVKVKVRSRWRTRALCERSFLVLILLLAYKKFATASKKE